MVYHESTGIALEWVTCASALIFVLSRVYAKWPVFGASEWLIVVAWCFHCIGVSVDTALFAQGWAPPPYNHSSPILESKNEVVKTERSLQTMYADLPLQYISLWSVKIVFVFLYYQLIPPGVRWLRIALNITAATVVITLIISLLLNFFYCIPVSRNWNLLDPDNMCFSWNEVVPYWSTLGFHLATELMIYILPFFLLRDLKISKTKFYGVIFLFSLGFFSVLCTIARAICSGVPSAPGGLVGMFGAMEQGSGIIVACCPALKQLLFSPDEENSRRRRGLLPQSWMKSISLRERSWRIGSDSGSMRRSVASGAGKGSRKSSRIEDSSDGSKHTNANTFASNVSQYEMDHMERDPEN